MLVEMGFSAEKAYVYNKKSFFFTLFLSVDILDEIALCVALFVKKNLGKKH